MRIDGLPWRTWLWIAVKSVLYGSLVGAVAGGGLDMIVRWLLPDR